MYLYSYVKLWYDNLPTFVSRKHKKIAKKKSKLYNLVGKKSFGMYVCQRKSMNNVLMA